MFYNIYFQEILRTTSFQTDNKSVFQRVQSLIGRKTSKDKMATESEENLVAQLTKDLEQCRKERDRYKVAHLTSEAEKKELITNMEYEDKLKTMEIENLKIAHRLSQTELKLKSVEIENVKRESDNLKEKLQANRDEIDRCKHGLDSYVARVTEIDDEMKSKSAEIENLKNELDSNAARMTKTDKEIQLKSEEIENLKLSRQKSEAEYEIVRAKMECDIKLKSADIENFKRECECLNKKLQTSTSKFDRCKNELDTKVSRMNEMDDEIKSKSTEIEKLQAKIDNEATLKAVEIENLKITQSKAEVEWKSLIAKLESDINSAKETEYPQSIEAQWKSAMARMDNEIKSKAEEIKNLKRKSEDETARSLLELDNVNRKLEASRDDFDRYKRELDAKKTEMVIESSSMVKEIEYLQKMECELKSRISKLEQQVVSAKNLSNQKISGDVTRGFEKVDKNLRSLLDRPTEMTIRWRFTEISKLTKEPVYSQPTEFAGMTWRIQVEKRNDQFAMFLEARKFGAAKWTFSLLADLQLLSQKDDTIVKNHKFEKPIVYNEGLCTWGNRAIIPFEDLLKGDADKDDTILVAAVVKAFPSN